MLFCTSCKATFCISANFVFYFVNGKPFLYNLVNNGPPKSGRVNWAAVLKYSVLGLDNHRLCSGRN